MAQELKKPTLEDLIPGGETYHKPENKSYQWWGDAACLELGIDNIEGTWAVKGLGAKPGEKFTAITLEEANALLEEKGLGKLRHFHAAKAVNVPRGVNLGIQVQIDPLLLLNTGKYRALVDWKKKKVIWSQPCPAQAANEDWNEVSRHLAYTIGNNLYVMTGDGQTLKVTNEPEGIVCGQTVHRNEFGFKRHFLDPERQPARFLPYERKHGHPLSDCRHHCTRRRSEQCTLSDGRHDEPSGKSRYLQSCHSKAFI